METEIIFSIAHLDYLQRVGLAPAKQRATDRTSSPPEQRRLLQVQSVGVIQKQPDNRPGEVRSRLASEDLLTGLFGYKIPVAFLVHGSPEGIAIHLGIWAPARLPAPSSAVLDRRQAILRTLLTSLYPAVQTSPAPTDLLVQTLAGLVVGMPTAKAPDPVDGALALDRLIRAMAPETWTCLVLAEPVEESSTSRLRHAVIEEMRSAQAAALPGRIPQPLVEAYIGMLQTALKNLTSGLSLGAWRTGVYLLGDEISYPRLASLWRGIFSGDDSLPEPVQVWNLAEAAACAQDWALPNVAAPPGPGYFSHPLLYQSILTSRQLAAYIHLPRLETGGFSVQTVPDFDVVSPVTAGEGTVTLGEAVLRGQPTSVPYLARLDDLSRHVFVAGITGSGKTNTVKHLLQQVNLAGVPFLVIEPAKAEYRQLLGVPALSEKLQVFTLGNEPVSPLRLNPFEVTGWPETSVTVHLDLLRSVFVASFGMWTPLPQILEQCLYGIYRDRGWDIVANQNPRLAGSPDSSPAFPTLSELAAKADEVIGRLGYDEEIASRLRAALLTRLNSLRTGGKGRMLDVQYSLPMEELLENPTVLELEGMGDDDDKAFVMGLLFIRLVEYRRAEEKRPGGLGKRGLRHLLVIEEAHRLLANVGERYEEEGNPRGKAVETFANLLSEIRAYSQGVIVADQVPVKLAPDVIKNTNLKIAHRVVAADDRSVLAGAMAMNERQSQALAILTLGQAAVFSEGDDAPVVVKVKRAEGSSASASPGDAQVAVAPARRRLLASYPVMFQPLQAYPGVADSRLFEAARRLAEDQEVMRGLSRVILSAIQTHGGLSRTWPDLVAVVESRRPAWLESGPLLSSVIAYASTALAGRRGALAGLSYAETDALGQSIQLVLEAQLAGQHVEGDVQSLREWFLRLQGGGYGPYFGCQRIWAQRDGPCLCRYPVAELVMSGAFDELWRQAAEMDRNSEGGGRPATWDVCQDATYHLVEFPGEEQDPDLVERLADVARCTALCFGQQQLASLAWTHPRTQRVVLEELIEAAGHE